MTIRRAVNANALYIRERFGRWARWVHTILSDPPMDESEDSRREEDDSVFQPRDLGETARNRRARPDDARSKN